MHLANKNIILYFCTALFCHVALLSVFYYSSYKDVAGIQQTNIILTHFYQSHDNHPKNPVILSIAKVETLFKTTQTHVEQGLMTQQSRRIFSGWQPSGEDPSHLLKQQHSFKKDLLNNTHNSYTQQAQDDSFNAAWYQGHSRLLAVLHTAIQENQIYPLQALMAHQSGTTVIDFTLLPNGILIHSTIGKSSGYPALDQAALEAVQAISPFKALTISIKQHFNVAVSFAFEH